MTLAQVEEVFGRWLAGEDPIPFRAVIGAYAANLLQGDPVWLMLVGGSGRGKTELVDSLRLRPDVRSVSSITHESALLSATPRKEQSKAATGGLLRQIGDRGILVIKDFTSIISMHREARAGVVAALREIYDGHWDRLVGSEGGRSIGWSGHIGVIAGCTTVIDSAHAVMGLMGERFLFVRIHDGDSDQLARKALGQAGQEVLMRQQMSVAVDLLFADGLPEKPHRIDETVTARLVALVGLVVRARSPVSRDFQGEVELVLDAEGPTRITKALAKLYSGLGAAGLDAPASWEVVVRAGLDSIPKLRPAVMDNLMRTGRMKTSDVARGVNHPTRTTKRALEDLQAHGVVVREEGARDDHWSLSQWSLLAYRRAQTAPETSGDTLEEGPPYLPDTVYDDKSGTVCAVCGAPAFGYELCSRHAAAAEATL